MKPWNALPEFVVSSRNIQIFESKDWTKHGKISQFVFATKKSSNSDYEDLDTEDYYVLRPVPPTMMMMMIYRMSEMNRPLPGIVVCRYDATRAD